jgi:hypothetical protein
MKSSRSVSSPTGAAKKSTRKTSAAEKKSVNPDKNQVFQDSKEQVALRAYFIGERRRSLGIAGDETSDWVQAEQELSEELKVS